MGRKSWTVALCCVVMGASALGCRKANPLPVEQPKPKAATQTVQSQAVVSSVADEQSCRAFVQKFYD
jgi:hypothetical protein